MLRVWNVTLICTTFSLALLGTFLVRSGILESIHAFGESTVGGPLLVLIGVVIDRLDAPDRLAARRPALRASGSSRCVSREAIFLVNNLLLVGLAAVIFWGTFFPLISELFTGRRPRLRRPGSTATRRRWRSCSSCSRGSGRCSPGAASAWAAARRLLAWPALAGRGAAPACCRCFTDAGLDTRSRWCMFALASFALAALVQEFARGAAAYRSLSRAAPTRGRSPALFARNRRRYGGYVVHAGIAILLIAVAASSSFQTSRDLRLRPGPVGDRRPLHGSPTRSRLPRSAPPEQRLDLRRGPQGHQGRQAPTRPSIRRATTTPAWAAEPR